MKTFLVRGASGLATAGLVLGLSVAATGAQTIPPLVPTVSVTGKAVCDAPGTNGAWGISWTVENTTEIGALPAGVAVPQGSATGSISISSATQSGAGSGSVTLSKTFLNPGDAATGVATAPNSTGTVTLTVVYTYYQSGGNVTATGTVALDGSCGPTPTVPETAAPTTGAPSSVAAAAVGARPTFTG